MKARLATCLIVGAAACSSPDTPTAPGGAPSIRVVGTTPGQGATIVPELCAQGLCATSLTMTFEVTSEQALQDPLLDIELLGDQRCGTALGFPDAGADPSRLRFTARDFVVGDVGAYGVVTAGGDETCAYPHTAGSVRTHTARVSLKVHGDVLTRADFALDYTFEGPPLSPSPTAPGVEEICWEIPGPSGGWCGDMPLPDDRTDYRCRVADPDGDALSLTLSFLSSDGCLTENHCWSESRSFDPRLAPLPVAIQTVHTYPETRGARVTCRAVDSRGRSSDASVCFGNCS